MQKILLIILLFCSHAYSQQVPGTNISVPKPDGFTESKNFPGYMGKDQVSSIMVTELTGAPFSLIKEVSTSGDKLAEKGMKLISKEEVLIGELRGLKLTITQINAGKKFYKQMLIFGNDEQSNMVVATSPIAIKESVEKTFDKTLRSVTWDLKSKVDYFGGLSFRFSETRNIKIDKKFGFNLIMGDAAGEMTAIAGQSISPSSSSTSKDLAKQNVLLLDDLEDIKIISEQPLKIDDLSGHEIIFEGKDSLLNEEIKGVYVVFLRDDRYYYFTYFTAPVAEFDKYLIEIRELTNSLKFEVR